MQSCRRSGPASFKELSKHGEIHRSHKNAALEPGHARRVRYQGYKISCLSSRCLERPSSPIHFSLSKLFSTIIIFIPPTMWGKFGRDRSFGTYSGSRPLHILISEMYERIDHLFEFIRGMKNHVPHILTRTCLTTAYTYITNHFDDSS